MQIDIIERDGETIIVADKPKPAETQLHGKALQDGLIAEIQAHAEQLAAEGPDDYVADGVLRSLYWSAPNPEECSVETLSTILTHASYLLEAQRGGLDPRLALRTLPGVPPAGEHRPTGRSGRNPMRSCAAAARIR